MQVVCCLVASCAQYFRALEVTTTSRSAAFLNLLADLGLDLYKSRFSIRLNSGRCSDNPRSKEDSKMRILPRQ